jgi:hypothetical protein
MGSTGTVNNSTAGSRGRNRQLDVNRAVQLLKLTATRSNKKNSAKLPPWFTRTQDAEDFSWAGDASGADDSRPDMAADSWDSDGAFDVMPVSHPAAARLDSSSSKRRGVSASDPVAPRRQAREAAWQLPWLVRSRNYQQQH